MNQKLTPELRDAIETQAVRQVMHDRREAFVEYVLGEAGTTYTVRGLTRAAVIDALEALHYAGYPVDDIGAGNWIDDAE